MELTERVAGVTGGGPGEGPRRITCDVADPGSVRATADRTLAELGPHGIRVNAVAPGITEPPMNAGFRAIPGMLDLMGGRTPLGGIAAPATIAQAVVALLRMDWVTGHTLVADGGCIAMARSTCPDRRSLTRICHG